MSLDLQNDTYVGASFYLNTFDNTRVLTVILGVVTGILLCCITSGKRNCPPCPWGFPVVGHLPFLIRNPLAVFEKWREIHGDVFGIRLGSWNTVVVNGPGAVRGAMGQRGVFCSRPPFLTAEILRQESGNVPSFVFGESGAEWKRHRKLLASALEAFTREGNVSFHDIVQDEANRLANKLVEASVDKQTATFLHQRLTSAFEGVMYQLLFGKSCDTDTDPNFQQLVQSSEDFVAFFKTGIIYNAIAWLASIIPWKMQGLRDIIKEINRIRITKQHEHEALFDKENIRDIMDALLAADISVHCPGSTCLSRQELLTSVNDLLMFASVTITAAMKWVLYFMTLYPDVQKRVQIEIDEVTGKSRNVTATDRRYLPFTEATMYECLRIAPIIPYAIPRFTTCDTTLNGYSVDKGTVVFPNLYSVSMDKNTWEDPTAFRPERFLTDAGELDVHATNRIVTFGLGERRCFGQKLARKELFTFTSTLLQRCTFNRSGSDKLEYEILTGMVYEPRNFNALVEERNYLVNSDISLCEHNAQQ